MRRITKWVFMITAFTYIVGFACAQTKEGKASTNRALFENKGSLHEAAKAAGGRYVTSSSNLNGWMEYQSIKSLAEASSLVLVGSPTDNVCRVSSDGRDVQTVYQFRVETSLKGHFRPGDTITVALPGGRVSFEDGTTAQVNTPGYKRMVNGYRYVLFLRGNDKGKEVVPTGGSQGIFELTTDGTVKSQVEGQAVSRETGKREFEFMNSLRSQVEGPEN